MNHGRPSTRFVPGEPHGITRLGTSVGKSGGSKKATAEAPINHIVIIRGVGLINYRMVKLLEGPGLIGPPQSVCCALSRKCGADLAAVPHQTDFEKATRLDSALLITTLLPLPLLVFDKAITPALRSSRSDVSLEPQYPNLFLAYPVQPPRHTPTLLRQDICHTPLC